MLLILKKYKIFISFFVLFSIITITAFYFVLKPKKNLPIYNPADVNPELVDSTVQYIANEHFIPDFKFTNQNGKTITQEDYKGKIYVADFFFTTCQSICPKMTNNMAWLQERIKNNPKVLLLSHSVTPDIDSVSVLKKYALEKGVIDSKWNLVTGNKKDIYYLARKSYLVVKTGKPSEMYDMVHTENFVLVDSKKRIRGFYDGTNLDGPTEKGIKNVKQLLEDIIWLCENDKP
ncbi:MAG: SCO family protein [Flavobacterium sp.]|nr:SCO family protein [Flavobacterium sp.]